MNWATAAPEALSQLDDAQFTALLTDVYTTLKRDRQFNQLKYYKPTNPTAAKVHLSTKRVLGVGGGNRASKTTTTLVELIIRCTGVVPDSLKETYPREKLRGPITARVVLESLTTTLVPVFHKKLQYWQWNGIDRPGGERGHWGLIPKHCLIDGDWKSSWSDRLRVLRLLYRDEHDEVVGESTIQFMSHDQHPTDFASGEFHFVLHDEPPSWDIWKEDRARVMSLDGTLMLAMTWPDNPAIPVDWIFDEVYDRAAHDPDVEWINIFTTDNPHLDQASIASNVSRMSSQERAVRIFGQPIRFSNRVHPDFTDQPRTWCFHCGKDVLTVDAHCGDCGSTDITPYCHVTPVDETFGLPCLYLLDPHPRRPHMMTWVQVTPSDDLQQVAEASVEGGPDEVKRVVDEIEMQYNWSTVRRLIDPNMGKSPSSAKRGVTWQDEFTNVGLACDTADDSDVGRQRLNDWLKPDPVIKLPRFLSDPRCTTTHQQLKRYTWDEYRDQQRETKQKPRMKDDDYPTLLKYLMNEGPPSFRSLKSLGLIYHRQGHRAAVGY